MKYRRIIIITTLLLLAATSCTVAPNYSRPSVPSQAGWKEQTSATNAATLPVEWWHIFNDAELDSLEAQAVEANQDLKAAVARVTEARALARATKAELYPSVSAGAAYYRTRISQNRANTPP